MSSLLRRSFLLGAAAGLTALATGARAASRPLLPGDADVLLVIDVQNCFLPGGALPVKGGDEVVPLVNRLARQFRHVVLTQDWHTSNHVSFASRHPGKKPFELIQLAYGPQVLWPDHCVQGTPGAELAAGLTIPWAELVLRKGYHAEVDSYSAFYEADGRTATGLSGYLRQRGLRRVFLCGLATDFCVASSAVDARRDGFETLVIEDATRAVALEGSLARAWERMARAGVRRIQSAAIGAAV